MSDENSWIDDVITQHKQQWNKLKQDKNTLDTSTSPLPHQNSFQNNSLKDINQLLLSQAEPDPKQFNPLYQSHDVQSSIHQNNTITNNKYNNLTEKIAAKKSKIVKLKLEIKRLREENLQIIQDFEAYKEKTSYQNKQYINSKNNEGTIEKLQSIINKLQWDKQASDNKIYILENLKSQEIDIMNKKIKDFEIVIDENSNNYLKDLNSYKQQIAENNTKMHTLEKYMETVNFFIQKINTLLNLPWKNVYDIEELQDKLIFVENVFAKALADKNQGNNVTLHEEDLEWDNDDDDDNKGKDQILNSRKLSNDLIMDNYTDTRESKEESDFKKWEKRINYLENELTFTGQRKRVNKHCTIDNPKTTKVKGSTSRGKGKIQKKNLSKKMNSVNGYNNRSMSMNKLKVENKGNVLKGKVNKNKVKKGKKSKPRAMPTNSESDI